MTKQWYEYDYTLLFGQGDPGIGGEHGTDFATPIDTPITFLASGTITDISYPSWGIQVTWKLDNPYQGIIPYAYQIHLDALNPDLQVGSHVKAGELMGWSGGAINYDQIGSASNPTGKHYLDSSEMSEEPHTEFGFCYGPAYGSGDGFLPPGSHPELNPKPFLDMIRAQGPGGDTNMTIDLSNSVVGGYFSLTPDGQWQCKQNGFIVRKGILAFYCAFGQDAYCGLTHLGLPLSNETPVSGHPGVVEQKFERALIAYDPNHELDRPPGARDVYLMRLPR